LQTLIYPKVIDTLNTRPVCFQVNCKSHEAVIVRIESEVENLFLEDHASFTIAEGTF